MAGVPFTIWPRVAGKRKKLDGCCDSGIRYGNALCSLALSDGYKSYTAGGTGGGVQTVFTTIGNVQSRVEKQNCLAWGNSRKRVNGLSHVQ